jgi:hypothetical protein
VRILKASILGIAAAAVVFAVVGVENPRLLFANAELLSSTKLLASTKAFLVRVSRPRQGTGEATPVTQSTTVAQALPPVAPEAPTGGEIATPFKTADRSETETRQPPTESLLGQFQAWAAGENARAEVSPAQPIQDAAAQPVQDIQPQPVQDAQANPGQDDTQAKPVGDARAQIRAVHKRQTIRHVRHAPSEIGLKQSLRVKLRRQQNARVRLRPAQDVRAPDIRARDARAQEPPVQNARTPTFLESLGLRDPASHD